MSAARLGGPTIDNIARFLAGLGASVAEDPLAKWRRGRDWVEHAAALDKAFDAFRREIAEPFRCWARGVATPAEGVRTIFYPFSGPDFPLARLLRPSAEVLILCGRERWTPLPTETSDLDRLAAGLPNLREFLGHYLGKGFFVTKDMADGLAAEPEFGVAHALLALISRMGCAVVSLEIVSVGRDGQLEDNPNLPLTGLQIGFHDGDRFSTLYFFQSDLRDAYFSSSSSLAKFVGTHAPCVTFCKCASYLLHEPQFGNLGRFILDVSTALIQDDTSLPFRMLDREAWEVSLHGRYASPLPVFARHEQGDLRKAYDRPGAQPEPLNFSAGYGSRARSGFIVAKLRK